MGVSESSVPDNDVAGAPAAPPGGHSTALNACTEYELVGIVAHTGSMSGGHYYSFIKDKGAKDGEEGEQWFEYNDEHVRPFDHVSRMEDECFGGSYQREVMVTEKVVEQESTGAKSALKRWTRTLKLSSSPKRVKVKTIRRKKIITEPKTKSAYLLVYDRKDLHATPPSTPTTPKTPTVAAARAPRQQQ